jgi:hypothetical protein
MSSLTFTLKGAPRTKKTHNRIVQVKGKGGTFPRILPSAQHVDWFHTASLQLNGIRESFRLGGCALPIEGPVAVKALFYREAEVGDWTGYVQALADLLGWQERDKQTRTVHYLGIIRDDVQIQHWDHTRLLKDAKNPRVEVEVFIL